MYIKKTLVHKLNINTQREKNLMNTKMFSAQKHVKILEEVQEK